MNWKRIWIQCFINHLVNKTNTGLWGAERVGGEVWEGGLGGIGLE